MSDIPFQFIRTLTGPQLQLSGTNLNRHPTLNFDGIFDLVEETSIPRYTVTITSQSISPMVSSALNLLIGPAVALSDPSFLNSTSEVNFNYRDLNVINSIVVDSTSSLPLNVRVSDNSKFEVNSGGNTWVSGNMAVVGNLEVTGAFYNTAVTLNFTYLSNENDARKLSIAQITGSHYVSGAATSSITIPYSGSVTTVKYTMTGNTTFTFPGTIDGAKDGDVIHLLLQQDGTGGRTSSFTAGADTGCTITTNDTGNTANARKSIMFVRSERWWAHPRGFTYSWI